MVAGHYVMQLARRDGAWSVAAITLQTYDQTGNQRLREEASQAAALQDSR
jgi:hypothetical protein